jgi:hypothetical protein
MTTDKVIHIHAEGSALEACGALMTKSPIRDIREIRGFQLLKISTTKDLNHGCHG